MAEYFLAPVEKLFADGLTAEDNVRWVQAFPFDTWDHPIYGSTTVNQEIAQQYVKNFKENIRGQDIAINYDHGLDKAKGNKAAGWIRDAEVRDSGVFLKVEFTPPAVQELRNGEWKYFSTESFDEWQHPHTGQKFQYVLTGGALTNKPWVKGMLPINFSEVMTEQELSELEKEFAVWSAAYVDNLPDSAFLYIESGGKKDSEGKTVPRSLRHLPYKDDSGKIDLAHLRNAIARAPQLVGTSDADKKAIQSRAQRLLAGLEKKSSESEEVQAAFELLMSRGFEVTDEMADWEHSEPGTGSPPLRRSDEDGSDDPDRTDGWRRPTPPDQDAPTPPPVPSGRSKGGSTVDGLTEKDLRDLRNVLDVDSDDKIVEAIKVKFGELDALRQAVSAADQEKIFAEQYPQYWNEHRKLMERDRDNTAKAFSESVSRIRKAEGYGLKDTKSGLSAKCLETVREVHKKFAEGTATIEDFEGCLKEIVNGGIVEFGEIGSSSEDNLPEIDTSTAGGVAGARKLFAEVVSRVQSEHPDWEYTKCLAEAGKKHPDLAESYRIALPA